MRLLYFAWVREKIGLATEDVDLPPDVATVEALVAWLKQRGEGYDEAFARPQVVRAALDKVHVKPSAAIGAAREIAFFPPVTGG
ncbi:molybdopterin converting factor subunit 1 [Hyphomicrobium sp. NDB2Meth4]|uniref:molybdopterin converting factor subunit 1 n=1 Tax=Hyphomicrobium sp. NDB2Meth4 TaxID=1892846 RepID=UPI000931B3C0|nr:molybdopterin converting factor subunit 1 [Hyphomicrobium sp. NDB2Meth4]